MTNKATIDQALVDLLSEVEQSPDEDLVADLAQLVEIARRERREGVSMAFDAIRKALGVAALNLSMAGKDYASLSTFTDATTALQQAVEGEC